MSSEKSEATSKIRPRRSEAAEFIPALRAFFARKAHRDDIDDLIQEVLIRMHGRSVAEIENLDCYIFQVAMNVLRDRYRRDQVRCRSYHCELTEDHHPLDDLSPERVVWAREELRQTIAAMNELPERTRKVLVLLRWEGLTYPQVAERLAISVSAVEKHVTRSMRHLMARLLEDHEPQNQESRDRLPLGRGGQRLAGAIDVARRDARGRVCC
jgi:RNA polymerase sigma-70 factor (ECF subfamily)